MTHSRRDSAPTDTIVTDAGSGLPNVIHKGESSTITSQMNRSLVWNAMFFHKDDSGWHQRRLAFGGPQAPEADMVDTLLSGEIKLRARRFRELEVGGIVFTPN